MITRSNLAEQLRDSQVRSKSDVIISVIWELFIFAFLVFSGVSLYYRHMRLSLLLICITALLLVCMKITKQVRQNRKSKRRMLLPLSM